MKLPQQWKKLRSRQNKEISICVQEGLPDHVLRLLRKVHILERVVLGSNNTNHEAKLQLSNLLKQYNTQRDLALLRKQQHELFERLQHEEMVLRAQQ